jgi:sarcosine oxidase subunit gamma
MADPTTLRRSPLHHLHDRLQAERVAGELGAALPEACGQVTSSGPHSALWLGPDEWLVVSEADPGALAADLRHALAGDRGAVVDVSANRTVLELSGPAAREALEKGCPVDLHPRSFGPGRAVATTLGPVPVLLWQTGGTTYRVLPRSSFADYVARWLLDAATEYEGPRVP